MPSETYLPRDADALLMTRYADEDAVTDARGSVPMIRKPIDLDELMRRIA